MSFTNEDLSLAASEERGPFYEWLGRVHATGGDELVRAFAIELLRTVEPLRFERAPELLDALVAWIDDPDENVDVVGRWMACDSWPWRETAKLALEWGGATRTGASLLRQVAVVSWCYLFDQDPRGPLATICVRLPALPD